MASSVILTKIYKVTVAQWSTLVNGGTLSVGGVNYTYDANAIYFIEETSSPIYYDIIS